jgi:hypothetical protein
MRCPARWGGGVALVAKVLLSSSYSSGMAATGLAVARVVTVARRTLARNTVGKDQTSPGSSVWVALVMMPAVHSVLAGQASSEIA